MGEGSTADAPEEPAEKRWTLRALGAFQLTGPDGADVRGLGRFDRALLAYLVLSRQQQHTRGKLAAMFWPKRSEALHSLSESLRALRKALGNTAGTMLLPRSDPLICHLDAVRSDVLQFETLIAQNAPDALEQAETLYGAHLLDGIDIDSEEFNDWLLPERERLHALAINCLCRLMRSREETGLTQKALETARRILVLDQYCEAAHRAIIRQHLRAGNRSAALKHGQSCEDLFRRDGIDVEPETQTLLLELRQARTAEPSDAAALLSASAKSSLATAPDDPAPAAEPSDGDDPSVARKLAAILAADVAGYTRLMERDETGTFQRLRTHRRELFEPEIAKHHGCIFKLMGDGLLAEFNSVVDAVQCAIVLQRSMAVRNADVPDDQRIDVRIGVNLGDVIVEGNDRYGDGVNMAARLQQLAQPGDVYVSRTVYNHVRNKLALGFQHLGEQPMKNIAEPVSIYRVQLDPAARPAPRPSAKPPAKTLPAWIGRSWWAAATAAILAAGAVVWVFLAWNTEPTLPLPDKPSIAVLPFENLTDDPKLARLADGLTEDVTTGLSRSRGLFVIARNSTDAYRGKTVDVRDVGHTLGVKYVLVGSIQAVDDGVRVNATLIDAESRNMYWTDKFAASSADFFTIQDDVTANIAGRLLGNEGALNEAERDKLRRKPPANLKAFDIYLLAMQVKRGLTKQDIDTAKDLLGQALSLDPELARAHVGLAWIAELEISLGYATSVAQSRENKFANARQAIVLDPFDGEAHAALATYYADKGDFQHAAKEFARAEELEPNNADILLFHGSYLAQLGEPALAVEKVDRAVRLNPNVPLWYNRGLRVAYYFGGRFDDATLAAERALPSAANDFAWLAIAAAQQGHSRPAAEAAAKALSLDPDWFTERRLSDFGAFARDAEPMLFIEGAHKAGLPICATATQLAQWPDMKRLAVCEQALAENKPNAP